MSTSCQMHPLCWMARLLVVACALCISAGQAAAAGLDTNPAASLRAKHAALGQQLSDNPFKQPLYLDSAESSSDLKADIYALVDYPFAAVSEALDDPAHWCDVLMLHLNTKYCRASTNQAGSILAVSVGKKYYQSLDQAFRIEFAFSVAATTPEYFDIGLDAKTGPLGTSDYRIRLEAVSAQGGKTFLHLTYSYAYNFVGRIALQAYLATTGRGKVGFTHTGQQADSQPRYIGGMRGAVERNTMRYYLALNAYLGALSTPPAEQLENRLQSWFTSTELYPLQLHEIDRTTYLDMKRNEYARQQKSP